MLAKLRHGLLSTSEAEKMLYKAKVDKTHDLIANRHLVELTFLLKDSRKKNELINELYRKMHSQNVTLRVKSLVVVHVCLRNKFDSDLVQIIDQEQVRPSSSKAELVNYLQENGINFYIYYLKKIVIDSESYQFVRNFSYHAQLEKDRKIQMMSHGFKILNLMNFILQSQQMFNKMGRYHFTHNQIINMFLQLLQDLDYFNLFIKKSIKILLNASHQHTIDNGNQLNLSSTSSEIQNPKIAEQIKHSFLYINQAQKISDRLYEFYHNRYYYKTIRNMITFPTFLQIDLKDYKQMKMQTKQIDKNLVRMVKLSKYDHRCCTQGNVNKTFSYDRVKMSEYTTDVHTMTNIEPKLRRNEQIFAEFVEEPECQGVEGEEKKAMRSLPKIK